jgi:hypothetical protein
MSETRIPISFLRMYFPRNWEFGSALSKLRNWGAGIHSPPPVRPLSRPTGAARVKTKIAVFIRHNLRIHFHATVTRDLEYRIVIIRWTGQPETGFHRRGEKFVSSETSRPDTIQSFIEWVPVKPLRRKSDHSSPCSDKVKNEWTCTSFSTVETSRRAQDKLCMILTINK